MCQYRKWTYQVDENWVQQIKLYLYFLFMIDLL